MTTISSAVSSLASGTKSDSNNSMSNLGINDFITLMTTQLKYQDPTQPQDSTQFIAQLAQFSTVSGVQEMNTSLGSLLTQLKSSQALSATSLVGHSVLVDANSLSAAAGESVSGTVNTPASTSNINLVISDASGQVVRQMSVAATSGESAFTWDGKNDSGQLVADGAYSFDAIANVAGKSTSLSTSLVAKVTSVTIDSVNNVLQLNTDALGSVEMSAVKKLF
ncbi:MAG: flagellar hook assembly protein FlgD [Steroidobacteraceae bacterium]